MKVLNKADLSLVSGGQNSEVAESGPTFLMAVPCQRNSIGMMQVMFDGYYAVGIENGELRQYLVEHDGTVVASQGFSAFDLLGASL